MRFLDEWQGHKQLGEGSFEVQVIQQRSVFQPLAGGPPNSFALDLLESGPTDGRSSMTVKARGARCDSWMNGKAISDLERALSRCKLYSRARSFNPLHGALPILSPWIYWSASSSS